MLPVSEPLFNGNEEKYLLDCIRTGWISSEGKYVKEFENMFSNYCNCKYGIAVSNGTAAVEVALYALDLPEGSEVIMPSFTIISCAVACLRLNLMPVLVDINPDNWTMDTDQIESVITDKTAAIMPVHIYGHPVDMDPVFRIAEKYNLKIIEDAAEVHGAEYYSEYRGGVWLKCGSMSDAASTSFYANKIVSTGEGGMVITNDSETAERARSFRNLCFRPEKRFFHTELGYNFRMSNLQAAVGLAQMEQIDDFIVIKRKLGLYYERKLNSVSGIRFMPIKNNVRSVYWMYSVELDPETKITAEDMMKRLSAHGIATRPFFMGLHEQPVLLKYGINKEGKAFPKTEYAYRNGFYLPSGLTLKESDIDFIIEKIEQEICLG